MPPAMSTRRHWQPCPSTWSLRSIRGSLILVRTPGGKNEVYLGDPALLPEDWTHLGAIAEPVARAILDGTRSGLNELTIQAQKYRFVRLFAQAADVGAIVFVTA